MNDTTLRNGLKEIYACESAKELIAIIRKNTKAAQELSHKMRLCAITNDFDSYLDMDIELSQLYAVIDEANDHLDEMC